MQPVLLLHWLAGDRVGGIHTIHTLVNRVVSLGNKDHVLSPAFAKILLLFVALPDFMLFSSSSVILVPAEKHQLGPAGFSLFYCHCAYKLAASPSLVPSLRAPWVFPGLALHSLFRNSNVSIVPIALFAWRPTANVFNLTGAQETNVSIFLPLFTTVQHLPQFHKRHSAFLPILP